MYVFVDSNAINSKLQKVNSDMKTFHSGINAIKTTVDSIGTAWQGNDYKNFVEKMDDFQGDLLELEQSMETYQAFINGYLEAMDKLNSYYSNKNITIK